MKWLLPTTMQYSLVACTQHLNQILRPNITYIRSPALSARPLPQYTASQQGLGFTLDPRILYRGLAMSVGNMAILTGLQFPLTGAVRSLMTGGKVNERMMPFTLAALATFFLDYACSVGCSLRNAVDS